MPRPSDFDLFWKDRMAEADAVGLDYAIETASVTDAATCQLFDLWYTGMCGARLHAKYLKPVSEEPMPLVLQFHGYPGASRSWFEQASFAGMGMALIALDCPGQGGPSEDIGGFEGTTVAGSGHAGLVRVLMRGCTVTLAADKTSQEYDIMLQGVGTVVTDPVPALSPECRAIDLYVTYRYFPAEYKAAPGKATLVWYVDGVQQPTRSYTLDGSSITPGFHIAESVWKRARIPDVPRSAGGKVRHGEGQKAHLRHDGRPPRRAQADGRRRGLGDVRRAR